MNSRRAPHQSVFAAVLAASFAANFSANFVGVLAGVFAGAATVVSATALPGQKVIFQGPVVKGVSAKGAPQITPIPGMKVTILFVEITTSSTPKTFIVSRETDGDGGIAIPSGYKPHTAVVGGPGDGQMLVSRMVYWMPYTIYIAQTAGIDLTKTGPKVDLSQVTGTLPFHFTASECSAFYHARAAMQTIGSFLKVQFKNPLPIRFVQGLDPFCGLACYRPKEKDLQLFAGTTMNPDASITARSASTMAHEIAHYFLAHAYDGATLMPYMDEGLADYLASVVTDNSLIGKDAIQNPRDVNSQAKWTSGHGTVQTKRYAEGLVIAGALFHTRARFANLKKEKLFDGYFGQAIAAKPANETELLCRLLLADDDDADLTNGTPHATIFRDEFTTRHGIPWPQSSCPGGKRKVTSIAAGWGKPKAPSLTASLGPSSLQVTFAGNVANSNAAFLVSLPPAAPLVLGPGLRLYTHPLTMLPVPFRTDATGRFQATYPMPSVGVSALAVSGIVPLAGAPFGHEVSNGLRIDP